MGRSNHLIDLNEKVSEKHIDQIINDFYYLFIDNTEKENHYEFDLSSLKWISNQELLILTGLLKYLIDIDANFKVKFLENGSSSNVDHRIAKQIVQIWDVWKIYQIVPHQDYNKYFDIDGTFIELIRERFKINSSNQQIYERYGVTPFLSLSKIEKYDDKAVSELLNKIYNLSEATNQILIENKCYLPFENKTLSSIITKELYENFLDHFSESFFRSQNNFAFLSLSLKSKIREDSFDKMQIQSILKRNFKEENIEELRSFFYDKSSNTYKNESLLQISFLDFGEGISKTLGSAFYNQKNQISESHHKDSYVLKYAFEPLSSQHNIGERLKDNIIMPRGLFDVVSIVKRFEGLIVVRSNFGKIAFDFSANNSIKDAIIFFGNEKLFFPGSLISIYIPERQLEKTFDTSSIKPDFNFRNYNFKKEKKKTIRLFDIQTKLKSRRLQKHEVYDALYEIMLAEFDFEDISTLIYFDFEGYEIDERIAKKTIYFLCSDYRINYQNNVVVLNPPTKDFLRNIKNEISELEEVDRKFKFHPTPFIYLTGTLTELEIFWLGVDSINDIQKLNDLLFEEHDLRASDFERPDEIVGHINHYDQYGNLFSVIDSKEIFDFYSEKKDASAKEEIKTLVENCIQKEEGSIYLCNGNYYQEEYLLLNEVLSNEEKLSYLTNNLFKRLQDRIGSLENVLFAGITTSSHKILDSLISQGHLKNDNCVQLNNYFSFEKEKTFLRLTSDNSKVILICDVISTGFLVNKFESTLNEHNVELIGIGVLVNAIDKGYKNADYINIERKLTSTFNYKLEKKLRSELSEKLKNKELKIIRINPFTNTPISHSIKETNSNESILISNQRFLDIIESSHLKIGYFEFNNLIHPYFFDMDAILDKSTPTSNQLLDELIKELNKKKEVNNIELIFYPKNSGIRNIDFEYFKNVIIPNHGIEFIQLDRFATNEGWRFSHPPKSLVEKCNDKIALILDDGSCSGESLLQMIDEVAFLEVKEILVLSIVGRVNDHKREFFSRIKSINAGSRTINVNIYFGSHWHLPTYHLSKSPIVDEINWLKIIQSYTNLPLELRKIIQVVHNELELKSTGNNNNNHIIKSKNDSPIIKDLMFVRNELGKLSEYRFYIEYFDYLNNLIAKYESKSKEFRGDEPYKDIELICGVIIHEPYLFESLKKIVPDLVDKLKEFISALFWKDKVIDQKLLTYDWDMKNFIHLIFIVFNENEIINNIGIKNLSILLNKYCIKTSDKVYLFYRILKKLNVNRNDKNPVLHSTQFLHLSTELISMIDKEESHYKTIHSFFASLPNDVKDYYSQLTLIASNYKRLLEDSSHNEYIFNDKQVIISLLKVIEKNNRYETDSTIQIKVVRKSWRKISEFIESILRFSGSFSNYFISTQDYHNLEINNRSLRALHGEISEEIYNGNFDNLSIIQENINELFDEFINEDTNYSKLFSQSNKVNLSKYLPKLISQIKSKNESFSFDTNVEDDIWVEFPSFYFNNIICN